MPKTFFITTAIDYTNSPPHIGHAYEKVLADVIARYHRLKGDSVFFLTGVDQHGQKVQQSAASDRHKKVVQGILQSLFDAGQIYKDKQAGYYSIRQEQFLTDKERGPDGEFGPEWGQVEFREEENYYFKLSNHKQWLLDYLKKRDDAVIPDFRQTELRNAVEKLSGDLCISRPKSRLDWGIELPFDKDFVNYVWFDALTNYISFAGYDPNIDNYEQQPQDFRDRWENVLQIIGKDILVPAHGIYWLIMLHAIGFPDEQMPQLLVHGWWNLGGAKMSKSTGNIVDPFALTDKYGAEALRYYLMRGIRTGKDADFAEEQLISCFETDLANVVGNLLNRSLPMIWNFANGKLTKIDASNLPDGPGVPEMRNLANSEIPSALQIYERDLTKTLRIDLAFGQPVALGLYCNGLIQITAPWKLAKNEDQQTVLDAVLYHLAETLRIIAILISPTLPKAAHGIFDQLNWKMELSGNEERFSLADAEWGGLPDGHVVGKPVPLFPRIETTEL